MPTGVHPRPTGIGRDRWISQKRAGVLCAVRLVRLVRRYGAPGGEAPRRGAFCLARVSRRGASPDEDPGIARGGKSPRPRQGVARNGNRQRERHPVGVVSIRRITGDPGSSALRASTPGLCRRHPCRGAVPPQRVRLRWMDFPGESRCPLRRPTRPIT